MLDSSLQPARRVGLGQVGNVHAGGSESGNVIGSRTRQVVLSSVPKDKRDIAAQQNTHAQYEEEGAIPWSGSGGRPP